MISLRLLRHATTILDLDGTRFLVDPVLGPAGCLPAVDNSPRPRPNPLVELPLSQAELDGLISSLGAVVATHLHRDHFDPVALERLPRDLPVLGQPEDLDRLAQAGFLTVLPVAGRLKWRGLDINRVGGQHGRGELAQLLGPVSGFVLSKAGCPKVYVAGDTVFCPEVEEALRTHRPEIIVLNAGAAQFLQGGPITMYQEDVAAVLKAAPWAQVVTVHLEAWKDRKSTRLNSSHNSESRMPSSA
jgi:L-ascorbate metabolism protein UlaG (beta-lactamase superfamily)